ncbi:MAG: ABC transporter permease [Fimbriimonadaceae bacterium]
MSASTPAPSAADGPRPIPAEAPRAPLGPFPPGEPETVIRPPGRFAAIDLREVWKYRDLLMTFVRRDITLRYRQTVLGVAWVLLQPLLGAGIFTVVFGLIARLPAPEGVPYFLLSYSGLLGWNLFNQSVTRITTSLTGNANLISKIYFPRLILPISNLGSILLDFLVAGALMAAMLAVYRIAPAWTLALVPLAIVVLLLTALGIGLWLAALQVSYRDVGHVTPVLLNLVLYATPVAYSLDAVPNAVRAFVVLNPLTGAIETIRIGLLGQSDVPWNLFAVSAAFGLAMFVVGAFQFKRMEHRFADVI